MIGKRSGKFGRQEADRLVLGEVAEHKTSLGLQIFKLK